MWRNPVMESLSSLSECPATARLGKWPASPRAWVLKHSPTLPSTTNEWTGPSPLSAPTFWTWSFSVVNYRPRTSLSSLLLLCLYFSPSLQDCTTSSISTVFKTPNRKTNWGDSAVQTVPAHTHTECYVEFKFQINNGYHICFLCVWNKYAPNTAWACLS